MENDTLATVQNARPSRTCNIPGVVFKLSRESVNEVVWGPKQFVKSRRSLNTELHRLCRGRTGRTALKQRNNCRTVDHSLRQRIRLKSQEGCWRLHGILGISLAHHASERQDCECWVLPGEYSYGFYLARSSMRECHYLWRRDDVDQMMNWFTRLDKCTASISSFRPDDGLDANMGVNAFAFTPTKNGSEVFWCSSVFVVLPGADGQKLFVWLMRPFPYGHAKGMIQNAIDKLLWLLKAWLTVIHFVWGDSVITRLNMSAFANGPATSLKTGEIARFSPIGRGKNSRSRLFAFGWNSPRQAHPWFLLR